MFEIPSRRLERFLLNELTFDETSAIRGIAYESLPEIFTISPRVLSACLSVWNTKGRKRISRSEAARRARTYFSRLAESGDKNAQGHLNHVANFEKGVEITEIGQQLYQDGSNIVVGGVHQGKTNAIFLRNNLDGIPDNKSIVNIHKHPNNLPQSFDDLVGILADEETVPERCMYFVVGPDEIHLLFPTTDTRRVDFKSLREQIRVHADQWIADKSLEYTDLVKKLAKEYKLGYYSCRKTQNFDRISLIISPTT